MSKITNAHMQAQTHAHTHTRGAESHDRCPCHAADTPHDSGWDSTTPPRIERPTTAARLSRRSNRPRRRTHRQTGAMPRCKAQHPMHSRRRPPHGEDTTPSHRTTGPARRTARPVHHIDIRPRRGCASPLTTPPTRQTTGGRLCTTTRTGHVHRDTSPHHRHTTRPPTTPPCNQAAPPDAQFSRRHTSRQGYKEVEEEARSRSRDVDAARRQSSRGRKSNK